jgi:hypothetical protein
MVHFHVLALIEITSDYLRLPLITFFDDFFSIGSAGMPTGQSGRREI